MKEVKKKEELGNCSLCSDRQAVFKIFHPEDGRLFPVCFSCIPWFVRVCIESITREYVNDFEKLLKKDEFNLPFNKQVVQEAHDAIGRISEKLKEYEEKETKIKSSNKQE